jgi:GTP-binding protein HflX
LPDGGVLLLTDTVGFIDRLPHALVAAFRATLEEVSGADIAVHVIDAASATRERSIAAVRRVLAEVGAEDVPLLDVFNKVDLLNADERRRLQEANPAAVLISAASGRGVPELLEAMAARVGLDAQRVTVTFGPRRGATRESDQQADREAIARLYRVAKVISQVTTRNRIVIEADLPRRLLERLPELVGEAVTCVI